MNYEREIERIKRDAQERSKREPWDDTGCRCTLRERLVGDGCELCNPTPSKSK